jgi:serine/threonine protein kinase
VIFSIKGNSKASVEVILKDDGYCVRKRSLEKNDSERLRKQAIKQKQMSFFENIKTPHIYYESKNELFFFDMEYIKSIDCINFLQCSTIEEINFFVNEIINLIDCFIEKSELAAFNKKIFYQKLTQINEGACENKFYNIKEIKKYTSLIKKKLDTINTDCKIPIGYCHGDITLSNVLIDSGTKQIYLIDFLDCFVETPLQDIVKFRQDTCFFWSSLFYGDFYDKNKLSIILKHMDVVFHKYFEKYAFYKAYYEIFQIFNFFRLVPYTKSLEVKDFITKNLKYLLNECILEDRNI